MRTKSVAVAVLLGAGFLVLSYVIAYRPWALTWGATDAEVGQAMPGDAIVPHPFFNATRAVTIRARPEDVWPWLVQMGYRRAGFYSYDRLDNDGIPSAERILPEYQQLRRGDLIPLSRSASVRVHSIEPCQSMVWVFESDPIATWVWGLQRLGPRETRLVSRLRVDEMGLVSRFIADTFEIVMMRKCLLGIKHRAEALAAGRAGARSPATDPSRPRPDRHLVWLARPAQPGGDTFWSRSTAA
jgi:hypothetical protein